MDIEILIKNGIVTHWLGNNEDVSDLFRNLTKQITRGVSNFYYSDLCQQLNDYCNSTCRKNKTILSLLIPSRYIEYLRTLPQLLIYGWATDQQEKFFHLQLK
ncbi:hypothetical protein Ancab_034459 [Ancistrocladus abbreviatus]